MATATKALDGVGDASLGEWHEWTGNAYHIRRRLSASEEPMVGPVVDVRGTPEGDRRVKKIERYVPPSARFLIQEECRRPV